MRSLKTGAAALAFTVLLAPVSACVSQTVAAEAEASVTRAEVLAAQTEWADGIVAIGQVYKAGGDYRTAAADLIARLYAYDSGGVLFKPTLAAQDPFRETPDEALSYFVGGSNPEDGGFAITPWSNVRWGDQDILLHGGTAFAMGHYYFTRDGGSSETKVEYTFAYTRGPGGELRISVHHSSLPYAPPTDRPQAK